MNDDILQKIKKLLSLGEGSSFEEEASAAILMAQRLMVKHNISQESISGLKESKPIIELASTLSRHNYIERGMASLLANNFKCTSYGLKNNRYRIPIFVGYEQDAKVVVSIYDHLITNLRKHMRFLKQIGILTSKHDVDNYLGGFYEGFKAQLKEQVLANEWGLIVKPDADVMKAVEGLTVIQKSVKLYIGDELYQQGYIDGKSVELMQKITK